MCSCCTNATQHAIIFFSILSFLLLPNAFNFNFNGSKSSTNNKPQFNKGSGDPRDVIGSSASTPSTSSNCNNINNVAIIDLATYFLYGVLFASSVALVLIAGTNPSSSSSSSPKVDTDEDRNIHPHQHLPMVGPSFPALPEPTMNVNEDRTRRGSSGGDDDGGVGYILLRTLPTFLYTKRRGAKIGKDIGLCVICQSQLRDGQMVRWLPDCDHLFHLVCINRWLAFHSTCPCCRAQLH